jgi:hypothetical protein
LITQRRRRLYPAAREDCQAAERIATVNDTRRIRIVVTRRRTVRWQAAGLRAHCPVCAREVETLACAQAAEVLEIDDEVLANLIAAGRVHAIALVSGGQRVCQASLFV